MVVADFAVDQCLDLANFPGAHCSVMRKIESRVARINQRALLLDMGAEHTAQGCVHEVRRGMVPGRVRARHRVHRSHNAVTDLQAAPGEPAMVAEHLGLNLARVFNRE